MADFYEVHGKSIEKAKGRVREIWNVAVREPLPMPIAPTAAFPGVSVTIVMFRAMPNGLLEPARDFDRNEISEWNRRHRNTPLESFGLPAGLLRS
jgi:hypothetical protein